jgi:hypothetical protein
MSEGGILFSDGIESDGLEFRSGMQATIDLADKGGGCCSDGGVDRSSAIIRLVIPNRAGVRDLLLRVVQHAEECEGRSLLQVGREGLYAIRGP